jgi:hypothetical protein
MFIAPLVTMMLTARGVSVIDVTAIHTCSFEMVTERTVRWYGLGLACIEVDRGPTLLSDAVQRAGGTGIKMFKPYIVHYKAIRLLPFPRKSHISTHKASGKAYHELANDFEILVKLEHNPKEGMDELRDLIRAIESR